MENNSMDLRSVIGWFFMIISVLLLIASFTTENGHEINLITGITFLIFGGVMYLLSRNGKKKAKAAKAAASKVE
ncbi:hypothetical protein GCM10027566_01770 [Arachidicoccus ginsenosidivorans]|jgi:hypothetical protein|uniref:Uncharacterized protein n=1 Tax=Arachidicoccus ginsenosidivorans TaxID=496057 RepID=A0A5B8VQU8_9BACT|nr:hypothetical protein [Arachidicoccus ginsenosidivorans]QEC72638.1 hypothetical protein FSB73_14080 [Arachidicoccus ginsenosidivorans]